MRCNYRTKRWTKRLTPDRLIPISRCAKCRKHKQMLGYTSYIIKIIIISSINKIIQETQVVCRNFDNELQLPDRLGPDKVIDSLSL